MSINKHVVRTLTVFIVCLGLQLTANCSEYSVGIAIRALPPELEVSEVVDNA